MYVQSCRVYVTVTGLNFLIQPYLFSQQYIHNQIYVYFDELNILNYYINLSVIWIIAIELDHL